MKVARMSGSKTRGERSKMAAVSTHLLPQKFALLGTSKVREEGRKGGRAELVTGRGDQSHGCHLLETIPRRVSSVGGVNMHLANVRRGEGRRRPGHPFGCDGS